MTEPQLVRCGTVSDDRAYIINQECNVDVQYINKEMSAHKVGLCEHTPEP
jgi:hypothetical protein